LCVDILLAANSKIILEITKVDYTKIGFIKTNTNFKKFSSHINIRLTKIYTKNDFFETKQLHGFKKIYVGNIQLYWFCIIFVSDGGCKYVY